MEELFGGIEAGGTKFVCAVGDYQGNIYESIIIPTKNPSLTMPAVFDFFEKNQHRGVKIKSLGIASFGPIDPIESSKTYGYIMNTPKADWRFFDFVGTVNEALGIPIVFDTDVNGAALGEWYWGAGKDLDTFVYLTVGTGIGGGGIINGKRMHGLSHPEMGHMRIPHDFGEDSFAGCCPFHQDCWEGLASGIAIKERWGIPGELLPDDHPAWLLEAKYLALGIANVISTLSPQRVILGGGVMKKKLLYSLIPQKVSEVLNDYFQFPGKRQDLSDYIVTPVLGELAGVKGAIALAINESE